MSQTRTGFAALACALLLSAVATLPATAAYDAPGPDAEALPGAASAATQPEAMHAAWATPVASGALDATTIQNGGFETGSLSGWTVLNEGAGAWYAYSGNTSPQNGFAIPAPPEGAYAATTDQSGAGSHLLMQDIAVPNETNATLSFILYYNNQNGTFHTPDSLSPNGTPNQQYRVDIMTTTSAPDSVAPGDVLANVFRTDVGDPAVLPPTQITFDLAPFAGTTVRLRFAEVDNQWFFLASVDDVRITNGTPPPPPPTDRADLVVTHMSAKPTQADAQSFIFTATIQNRGNTTASASTTHFAIDSPDGPSTTVGTPSLAPGQSVNVSTSPSPSIDIGNHTITARADFFDNVNESDEDNNLRTLPFVVVLPELADLSVEPQDIVLRKRMLQTDFTTPTPSPWGGMDVEVTVHNVGNASADRGFWVELMACAGPDLGPSDVPICDIVEAWYVANLSMGGSITLEGFWDTRYHAGDVEVTALISYWGPQERRDNDRASVQTYVGVGGTGFGGVLVPTPWW